MEDGGTPFVFTKLFTFHKPKRYKNPWQLATMMLFYLLESVISELRMARIHKSIVRNYAQKMKIALPEIQVPYRRRLYKANVTIDGFQFYNTLKDAEYAIARIGFLSLPPDIMLEDYISYKSLFQEVSQKNKLNFPKCDTYISGPTHMPRFSSTVNIGDKRFVGHESNKKKQAKDNAVRVAYYENFIGVA